MADDGGVSNKVVAHQRLNQRRLELQLVQVNRESWFQGLAAQRYRNEEDNS